MRGTALLFSASYALLSLGCSGEHAELSLHIDRSNCTAPCEIVRYDLVLERDDGTSRGCVYQTKEDITADASFAFPALEEGERLDIIVSAYCRVGAANEVEAPSCCSPLAQCLRSGSSSNENCIQAKTSCPSHSGQAEPWSSIAETHTYFDTWCTLRESCVQCSRRTSLQVEDGKRVNMPLQTSDYCAAPTMANPCP